MTEFRGQGPETGGQKSEVGGQRPEGVACGRRHAADGWRTEGGAAERKWPVTCDVWRVLLSRGSDKGGRETIMTAVKR